MTIDWGPFLKTAPSFRKMAITAFYHSGKTVFRGLTITGPFIKNVLNLFPEDVKRQLRPFLNSTYKLTGRGTEVPPGDELNTPDGFQVSSDLFHKDAASPNNAGPLGGGSSGTGAPASSSASAGDVGGAGGTASQGGGGGAAAGGGGQAMNPSLTSGRCTNFRQLVGWLINQVPDASLKKFYMRSLQEHVESSLYNSMKRN